MVSGRTPAAAQAARARAAPSAESGTCRQPWDCRGRSGRRCSQIARQRRRAPRPDAVARWRRAPGGPDRDRSGSGSAPVIRMTPLLGRSPICAAMVPRRDGPLGVAGRLICAFGKDMTVAAETTATQATACSSPRSVVWCGRDRRLVAEPVLHEAEVSGRPGPSWRRFPAAPVGVNTAVWTRTCSTQACRHACARRVVPCATRRLDADVYHWETIRSHRQSGYADPRMTSTLHGSAQAGRAADHHRELRLEYGRQWRRRSHGSGGLVPMPTATRLRHPLLGNRQRGLRQRDLQGRHMGTDLHARRVPPPTPTRRGLAARMKSADPSIKWRRARRAHRLAHGLTPDWNSTVLSHACASTISPSSTGMPGSGQGIGRRAPGQRQPDSGMWRRCAHSSTATAAPGNDDADSAHGDGFGEQQAGSRRPAW